MLLWMRSRANRAEHRRRFRSRPGIDATGDDADYCCSAEGSAMSAVNHQFRLAVGLAETFASASRTLSGWVRVSSRSPTPNRSRERGRSPGKPPLSDDDQWPLCANSGHCPTAWRTVQMDSRHAVVASFPRSPSRGSTRRENVCQGRSAGSQENAPCRNVPSGISPPGGRRPRPRGNLRAKSRWLSTGPATR
jgi:hypothetical protein